MTWYAWVVVAVLALNVVSVVNSIGKVRKPNTPGIAVAVLVLNGLMVWAIVALAERAA